MQDCHVPQLRASKIAKLLNPEAERPGFEGGRGLGLCLWPFWPEVGHSTLRCDEKIQKPKKSDISAIHFVLHHPPHRCLSGSVCWLLRLMYDLNFRSSASAHCHVASDTDIGSRREAPWCPYCKLVSAPKVILLTQMAVGQNPIPLVNIKIGGKWMFIHPKIKWSHRLCPVAN